LKKFLVRQCQISTQISSHKAIVLLDFIGDLTAFDNTVNYKIDEEKKLKNTSSQQSRGFSGYHIIYSRTAVHCGKQMTTKC
jgi:hypothetical protein